MFRAVVLALLIAAVSADIAPLLSANSPTAIKGSYIVVLKDGISLQERDVQIIQLRDSILNDANSQVGFVYGMKGFMGFSARLSEKALKQQLAHPNVKYIEADQTISLDMAPTTCKDTPVITQTGATWGLDRIDQRDLPLDGTYMYNCTAGAGVDVYVIDTGILATHVEFEGRATMVFNAVTSEPSNDLNGHGTHCAGTVGGKIYGVAKQASLKGVKVLNAGGSGTLAGVVAGVDYVANNKDGSRPSIGSMSLGGGANAALNAAVAALIAAGVPVIVAAGNSNANACNFSPASTPTAVTVGATARDDSRASYSNIGTCVTLFGPGSDITAAWIGSSNDAIRTISGTSMSTPHVAGVAALQMGIAPATTPEELKVWLTSQATQGKVTNPGTGSPNLLLYSVPTATA